MDIYIKGYLPSNENETGSAVTLRLPSLPEAIFCSCGAKFAEYNILDKGPVIKPSGEDISEYRFEGTFYGSARKNEPWIRGAYVHPKIIQTYFSVWKKFGVRLRLLITETPINNYVYLTNFEFKYSGAYGDYTYTVTFKDAKSIEVTTSKVQQTQPVKREVPAPSKTYTVVRGDTLWDIARKFYGSGAQYPKIYNANKDIIESTAKRYGKRSSENGHWIYPQTSLVIP